MISENWHTDPIIDLICSISNVIVYIYYSFILSVILNIHIHKYYSGGRIL